jgi:H+/Cl- antiporter ClcA
MEQSMYRKQLKRSRKQLMSGRIWRTRIVFFVGAILVGLSASLVAYGSDVSSHWFNLMTQDRPWLAFIITPVGLMLIIYLTRTFFPGAEGSGIPQAIAALHLKRKKDLRYKLLSIRIAIGKALMIFLGLLSGASIGREGPTIHIAASISFALTRYARFPHYDVGRGLILAGGAAGLAGAFNTPLAGIVFAIEELAKNFESKTSGTVLTAVIVSGLTALSINGNYSYFGVVGTHVEMPAILIVVLVCGVVGGLLGGAFSALLVHGGRRIAPLRNRHPYLLAGLIGLMLAGIGYYSMGQTWGTGYEEAKLALSGEGHGEVGYPLMKFAATLLSYWTGIPGGIFAPSLSIGAGLGHWLALWMPMASISTVALLGMAAYFTGVVQTPITAVVIIMEMTGNQEILLPLMATCLIADGLSKIVSPQPIYRALAEDFMRGLAKQEKSESAK